MYGILTFISFLPIFEVSYFRDKLFVHSYEVIQTVTKFAMFKGFNKHNDLLFNPWYDIDPETNQSRRRGVQIFVRTVRLGRDVRLVTGMVFISYASCITYFMICTADRCYLCLYA
jgi:hypothetical protein